MSKPICIRIDTDVLDKVRAIAKDQDRSINYVINQMILKGLQGEK